jgi:hypothetical protein
MSAGPKQALTDFGCTYPDSYAAGPGAIARGRRLFAVAAAGFHFRHFLFSADSATATPAEALTSGGLRGTVISVKDDALHLRVAPDNLRIEVARNAVISVTSEETKA